MSDSDKAALLVMDVEPGIVGRLEDKDDYVDKILKTVEEARKKHIPVFFVVVGFRPGFPEIGGKNKMFHTTKEEGSSLFIEPAPVISLKEGELVITKRRVSAFSGSDLEVILRAQGINHLVLCGIATSGVVLSTTREAADKDYGITILSDLCKDRDDEVHRVLIGKVFPRQADVMTAAEWEKSL